MKSELNIDAPDMIYAAIVKSTEGLTESECHAAMLRLVLLLANQIGDDAVLMNCIELATQEVKEKEVL